MVSPFRHVRVIRGDLFHELLSFDWADSFAYIVKQTGDVGLARIRAAISNRHLVAKTRDGYAMNQAMLAD